MHLVGFIIEVYCDAQPHESQIRQYICSNKVLTNFLSSDVYSFSFERKANIMGPEQEMGRELSGPSTGQPQQSSIPG